MMRTGSLAHELSIDAMAAALEVKAFADHLVRTLRVARMLMQADRMVSLEGLEAQVAQLCARCLGLDAHHAAPLRLHLLELRAETDATTLLLAAAPEMAPCPSAIC